MTVFKIRYKSICGEVVAALILGLLAISCNRKEEIPVSVDFFLEQQTPGLIRGSKYLFSYNELNSQKVFNKRRKMVRLQRDNQSSYINVIFSTTPHEISWDEIINGVEIKYALSPSDSEKRILLPFRLVKSNNYKFWLWNEDEGIGLIVEYP